MLYIYKSNKCIEVIVRCPTWVGLPGQLCLVCLVACRSSSSSSCLSLPHLIFFCRSSFSFHGGGFHVCLLSLWNCTLSSLSDYIWASPRYRFTNDFKIITFWRLFFPFFSLLVLAAHGQRQVTPLNMSPAHCRALCECLRVRYLAQVIHLSR